MFPRPFFVYFSFCDILLFHYEELLCILVTLSQESRFYATCTKQCKAWIIWCKGCRRVHTFQETILPHSCEIIHVCVQNVCSDFQINWTITGVYFVNLNQLSKRANRDIWARIIYSILFKCCMFILLRCWNVKRMFVHAVKISQFCSYTHPVITFSCCLHIFALNKITIG